MAIVTSSYADTTALYDAFTAEGLELLDFSGEAEWDMVFSEILPEGTIAPFALMDENDTDTEWTGTLIGGLGAFTITGSGMDSGLPNKWKFNQVVYEDNAPDATLTVKSTGGLTFPAPGANKGIINEIIYVNNATGDRFEFVGKMSVAGGNISVTRTLFEDVGAGIFAEFFGKLTVSSVTGDVTGTVTGFELHFDGQEIVVTGLKANVVTLLDDTAGQPAFEAMLALAFAKNDVFNSAEEAQTLTAYAGNDTYNIQTDDSVVETDIGGKIDHVFVEMGDGDTHEVDDNVERATVVYNPEAPEGTVTVIGNDAANLITGTDNTKDNLQGGEGKDTLIGKEGEDTLNGGDGADNLQGGMDDDTYIVELKDATKGALNDKITDPGGTDSLILVGGEGVTSFTYKMTFIDNLDLSGTDGGFAAKITGNMDGNLIVATQFGADSIDGGLGNDSIIGQMGDDTIRGGDGIDWFGVLVRSATGGDALFLDFTEDTDLIALQTFAGSIVETWFPEGLAPERLASNDGGTATAEDGVAQLVYDQSAGQLFYDPNGAIGVRTLLVTFASGSRPASLEADDFVGWAPGDV